MLWVLTVIPTLHPQWVKSPAGITACLGHVRIKRNSVHNCCGSSRLQFGGAEQVYLIQMAMLFAGIATLFQTVGFGREQVADNARYKLRIVGVLAGIAATQGLGVALTSCIIGGLIHFALGSVIANIRYLFPPLVTG